MNITITIEAPELAKEIKKIRKMTSSKKWTVRFMVALISSVPVMFGVGQISSPADADQQQPPAVVVVQCDDRG